MKSFNKEKTNQKVNENSNLKHFYVGIGIFSKNAFISEPISLFTIHVHAEDEPEANDRAIEYCKENIGILDDEYFDITEDSQVFD